MKTIEQEIQSFSQNIPNFFPIKWKDRLFLHDAIHVILWVDASPRWEEIVSIYQAVIFHDREFRKWTTKWPTNAQQQVTIQDIISTIVPAVRNFTHTHKWLTQEEIYYHYQRAKLFVLLMENQIWKSFWEIGVQKMKEMEISYFQNILTRADRLIPKFQLWQK